MNADSDLLLALYREARTRPTAAFQSYAIRMLQAQIPFASAVWTTGYRSGPTTRPLLIPILALSETYETDPEGVAEWRAINRADKTIPLVFGRPFVTQHIHTPTLFSDSDDAVMRDYARRFGRQCALITALVKTDAPLAQWCSLYRPRADDRFTPEEQARCQDLMPHLSEALKLSQLVNRTGGPTPSLDPDCDTAAVVAADGCILSAGSGFAAACLKQWHEFDGRWVPPAVMRQLCDSGVGVFHESHVTLHLHRMADVYWVTASAPASSPPLPARRLDVARLFAEGRSAKAIARALGISVSTVRNQVAASYHSLGVASRADLKAALDESA